MRREKLKWQVGGGEEVWKFIYDAYQTVVLRYGFVKSNPSGFIPNSKPIFIFQLNGA